MTSHFRLAVLIAGAAAVLSACASSDYAATVNDEPITDADVYALRTAEPGARAQGEQFRGYLTSLIVLEAQIQAAEEQFGLTGLDTPEARMAWLGQASDVERAFVQSYVDDPEFTDAAAESVATHLLLRDEVTAELLRQDDLLMTIWQDQVLLRKVCARHIVVATEDEALDARRRILDGEDFAAVAADVSADTVSPGGLLECPLPFTFNETFLAVAGVAPIGELTEPFRTDDGWHILLVESREFPESLEALASDPERWIPEPTINAAYSNWRDDVVGASTIVVRSQIGQWFARGDGILPPPASP